MDMLTPVDTLQHRLTNAVWLRFRPLSKLMPDQTHSLPTYPICVVGQNNIVNSYVAKLTIQGVLPQAATFLPIKIFAWTLEQTSS